jgi:hypothetical protein
MPDIELTPEQVQFYKTLPELENSNYIDATLTHDGVQLAAYGAKTAHGGILTFLLHMGAETTRFQVTPM